MRKTSVLFNKTLVIGIIILFIGAGVTSSISGYDNKSNNQLQKESYSNFPLNDGLLAYWKSDECDGTTLWDCSGHNYNGTIYADWSSGECLVFDGIDDYVDFDNHSENLGYNKTDTYTLSAWFQSTSSSIGSIYSMSHTDTARAFAYLDLNANGTLSYKTGDETCLFAVYTSNTYNDGAWHNVEVKFYGDPVDPTLEIYVDGDLKDSITEWLCPYLSEDFKTAKMGRRSASSTNYFDGIVDEVRIYKWSGNYTPFEVKIDGPTKGKPNIVYYFTFTSTDPEGNYVSYFIDWGDGTITGWSPLVPSATSYNASHAWTEEGVYTIKAVAKNTNGQVSEVATHKITIPRTRILSYLWYQWFSERFPILIRLLNLISG